MSKLLTVKQVAARLGVSQVTVYRALADGSLPCVRLQERIVRIEEEELQRFIAKGKTPPDEVQR